MVITCDKHYVTRRQKMNTEPNMRLTRGWHGGKIDVLNLSL
jgi:hypothetical protein